MSCQHRLPGFRTSCLIIGALYVLLSAGILAQGGAPAMAQYGVPEATLSSPHYGDAIVWVYLHMLVLGLVIGVVGWYGRGAQLQRMFSRVLLAAHIAYLTLDVIHSDSALGNGLYEGPASLGPAVIAAFVTALFLHLSLCGTAVDTPTRGESP